MSRPARFSLYQGGPLTLIIVTSETLGAVEWLGKMLVLF